MKLSSNDFENSPTCRGLAFVSDDAPIDMAIIEISGRYPEVGQAVNHECHEMVTVVSGAGSVTVAGVLYELAAGDVVHVPPETPFVWDGNMTITMACTPPFSGEQYEIIEVDK